MAALTGVAVLRSVFARFLGINLDFYLDYPMMGRSSGILITRRRSRSASAAATVIVPVLPANIRITREYFPIIGKSGVIPVDSPTVAKAEITSNPITSIE